MQDKPFLRPKDAAELLGVGESTFWRWAKDRPDFPEPIRLSARMTVFSRNDLMRWVEKSRMRPQSDAMVRT